MDTKTTITTLNVRESISGMMNSKLLRPSLERFHSRMADLGLAVASEGPSVSLVQGPHPDMQEAASLLVSHIVGELRFRCLLDPEHIQSAMEFGRELDLGKDDILSSRAFLTDLYCMLQEWEKADEPETLARVCISIFSANGNGMKFASMAEIENPGIIIEMTKSFVGLLLQSAPLPNVIQAGAAIADPQPQKAAIAPAETKPAEEKVADSPPQQSEAERYSKRDLERMLLDAGVDASLVREIISRSEYQRMADSCARNLKSLVERRGMGFAAVAVHRNRAILLGQEGPGIDALAGEIDEIRNDGKLMSRYGRIIDLLPGALQVPQEAVLLLVSKMRTNHIREHFGMDNFKLLLSRVPRDKLRRLIMSSPVQLCRAGGVRQLLDEHPATTKADPEILARQIMEAFRNRRPEAFVRAYVAEHLDTLASRSLAGAKKQVDYAGRMLLKAGKLANIPEDYTRLCMERGIIDAKEIENGFAIAQQEAPEEPCGHEPAPPTIRSAPPPPRAPQKPVQILVEDASPLQDASATPLPEADARPAESAVAPLAESAMPSEEPDILGLMDGYGIPYTISKEIAEKAEGREDADEAAYRLKSAADMIRAFIGRGEKPDELLSEFLSSPINAAGLFEPSRRPFFAKVSDFVQELQDRTSISPPHHSEADAGRKSVSIAMGDEATFKRIRSFRVPKTLRQYVLSQGLDVHELVYVTFKVFRWLNNRYPSDVKARDYEDNLRRFAGDAEREVSSILRNMTTTKPNSRIGLLGTNDIGGEYGELLALMRKMHHSMSRA